jgi:hypothetical protein
MHERIARGARAATGLALFAVACGGATEGEMRPDRAVGGKTDDTAIEDAACFGALVDRTAGDDAPAPGDLAARTDPLAQFVLRPPGECPETFGEIVARLREHDTVGCEGDARAGLRTMVVSETAQVLGRPDEFRSVTVRECGERPPQHLMFSLFGPRADASSAPRDAEIMAFDTTRGMFAFYTLEAGVWSFHGMSSDLVAKGSKSRCAACHATGGPVMKELDTPWVHWEGDTTTPGAAELVDAFDELGTKSDGAELEQLVIAGNAEWTEIWTKDLLQAGDVSPLLEPLFCDPELNVGTAARAASDPVRFLPAEALVDDTFDTGSFPLQVSVDSEAYSAAIAASGQRIESGGEPLVGPDGTPVVDTHFAGAFVQRSRTAQSFVERLRQVKAIDEDFILDVLAVDFTRPVFSPDRCGLLAFAPTLPELVQAPDPAASAAAVAEKFESRLGNCCDPHPEPGCTGAGVQACVCATDDFCCTEEWDALCVRAVGDRGCAACPGREDKFASPRVDVVDDLAEKVRQGFIENLEAAAPAEGTPAAQLLANLKNPSDAEAHRQRVAEMFAACNRREPAALADDLVRVLSTRRELARAHDVFEFEATLPVDDLPTDEALRLDPVTCELDSP